MKVTCKLCNGEKYAVCDRYGAIYCSYCGGTGNYNICGVDGCQVVIGNFKCWKHTYAGSSTTFTTAPTPVYISYDTDTWTTIVNTTSATITDNTAGEDNGNT